ncbi:hypothetical protein [Rhizobium sp. BK376]|uniref:hypothetical protein n=1 Tax=Rhizobium sp. BK376 TaxID=2512149 RepID=UPI0010481406|nr:hypothetical protein [Rhizobium sp. BK376]TCR76743.1 hypothetical protein EV561_1193 [Rhizobium sp. BK376]
MKINLLLNRLSFEKASASGDIAFNGWLHGPASGDPDIDSTLPVMSLRRETWGGVLVYGPTGQVYAVDKAAYQLLDRIMSGETLDDVSRDSTQDIESFRKQLDAHSLKL